MKRLILLTSALALTFAAPALAKGPDQATISGPGIDDLTFQPHESGALVQGCGFFAQSFGQTPDVVEERGPRYHPKNFAGPRYTIVYRVPGPDGSTAFLRQDVYPHAGGNPLTYMKPGQPFFGTERTRGGWFQAGESCRAALVALGVPRNPPPAARGEGASFEPWPVALGVALAVALAFATFFVTRRSRTARA